jgi:hypothetical protein
MPQPDTIQLSKEEMQLITNSGWIITKQNIIKKVYDMFGMLNEHIKAEIPSYPSLPELLKQSNGKITKGENYMGLPYVILDNPAHFSKLDVFAVRTMFWWGNYFSITLHVSGIYKIPFQKNNSRTLALLQEKGFFICINEDEWQHHFEESNYTSATKLGSDQMKTILNKSFFKTGKTIPFSEWDNTLRLLSEYFKEILELVEQVNS